MVARLTNFAWYFVCKQNTNTYNVLILSKCRKRESGSLIDIFTWYFVCRQDINICDHLTLIKYIECDSGRPIDKKILQNQ